MKIAFRYLSAVAFPAFALTLNAASTVPKPLETPSPSYPAALTDTGQKGSATIEVIVKADGSVAEAQVKSADHEAFGEAARVAIEKWRFEPATADGKPVDKRVTVPFNFVPPVTQMLNAKFKRKVFQAVPEAVLSQKEYGRKLKEIKPPRPAYPAAAKGATANVEVRYVVAPDGSTINPELVGNAKKEFMLPAILAIASATYEPPVKDGKGVYVEMKRKLAFEPPQPARRRGGNGSGEIGDGGGGGFGGGFGGGGGGTPDE
jgi:TonB family protein